MPFPVVTMPAILSPEADDNIYPNEQPILHAPYQYETMVLDCISCLAGLIRNTTSGKSGEAGQKPHLISPNLLQFAHRAHHVSSPKMQINTYRYAVHETVFF